jgi:23S rRNA (cytidine1920-2'-O)/16S rRNA (cytidine1409-2'-O)-methyltransferase
MSEPTERLDILVSSRGLVPTREKAKAVIMAGQVLVNGTPIDKPGTRIALSAEITLKARPRFVSRGGDKLAAALQAFPINPQGKICADVGASTGGFTDCLLQHGASRVFAIDVGYGILDASLRSDPRVTVMERTNARHLEQLPKPVSLVTVDASFISSKLLLPTIQRWLTNPAEIVLLIKPQFEAGKKEVDKGQGVIRDPTVHARVLHEVLASAQQIGLTPAGLIRSPLLGPAGNVEFLAWLTTGLDITPPSPDSLIQLALGG